MDPLGRSKTERSVENSVSLRFLILSSRTEFWGFGGHRGAINLLSDGTLLWGNRVLQKNSPKCEKRRFLDSCILRCCFGGHPGAIMSFSDGILLWGNRFLRNISLKCKKQRISDFGGDWVWGLGLGTGSGDRVWGLGLGSVASHLTSIEAALRHVAL